MNDQATDEVESSYHPRESDCVGNVTTFYCPKCGDLQVVNGKVLRKFIHVCNAREDGTWGVSMFRCKHQFTVNPSEKI